MHEKLMQRALQLAEKGRYTCSPNPMVGCVISRDGKIVGEGWHQRAGEAHAEINALRQAGAAANGATAYVNLEPCCHHGRTGPCVDALIQAQIKHVVIGCLDSNAKVAGKGIKALQEHGITVTTGVAEVESKALNHIFFHAINKKRPYVIAKYAMSIDGKLATYTNDSKWLTGAAARQHVHQWRHQVDAILVGSNTVRQDDPQLTARLPEIEIPANEQPLRIILDGEQALPATAKLFSSQLANKTLLVSDILNSKQKPHDLNQLLMELYQHDINSLIVEGGGNTLTQFFSADLVDEIHCYIAPKLVGGATAPTAFMGSGSKLMSQAKSFSLHQMECFADDVLLIYRRENV